MTKGILQLSNITVKYKYDENDVDEYIEKARTSNYSRDFYISQAENSITKWSEAGYEFIMGQTNFLLDIDSMDSKFYALDSLVLQFNIRADNSKLEERFSMPDGFRDTINDWVLSSKVTVMELKLPESED